MKVIDKNREPQKKYDLDRRWSWDESGADSVGLGPIISYNESESENFKLPRSVGSDGFRVYNISLMDLDKVS